MSKIEKQRLRISNIKHIFTHILEGNNKNTFRYDENEIAKFGDNNTYKYMNMILFYILMIFMKLFMNILNNL